jgi:hypothetical protein
MTKEYPKILIINRVGKIDMIMDKIKGIMPRSEQFGKNNDQESATFDDSVRYAQEIFSPVKRIIVRQGNIIDNLAFDYGSTTVGHGGKGGTEREFVLQEDEYIVSVSGTNGSNNGINAIKSLKFETSKNRSFSVGGAGESPFSYKAKENHSIVAFFGEAGQYLNTIGFYTVDSSFDAKRFHAQLAGMFKLGIVPKTSK